MAGWGDKGDRDDMGDMGIKDIKGIKGNKAHKAVSPKEPCRGGLWVGFRWAFAPALCSGPC